MENEILKDIIDYARRKLNASYGYCGVAEGSKIAMLNSDDGKGGEIKINITIEQE
jgi:hypothetical protein